MTLFFLLVVCTAIIGFFSQEFLDVIKRIFSIPGAKLVLPLVFASMVVESYTVWIHWGLAAIRETILSTLLWISAFFTFNIVTFFILKVLFLIVVAMFPFLHIMVLKRKKYLSKTLYVTYCVSAFLWTLAAMLLVTR